MDDRMGTHPKEIRQKNLMTDRFLHPVFKVDPTDTRFFPCPACREIIALGAGECRYCGAVIEEEQARALNAAYRKVTDAVASANAFRLSPAVAVLLTVLCVVYLLMETHIDFRLVFIEMGVIAAIGYAAKWFRSYGSLQTDDDDYPGAVRAMRITLAVWCVALILHIALIGYAIASGRLRVGEGRPDNDMHRSRRSAVQVIQPLPLGGSMMALYQHRQIANLS